MRYGKTVNAKHARWAMVVVIGLIFGSLLANRLSAPRNFSVRYKHSLEYPKLQDRNLLQVGSLDRG